MQFAGPDGRDHHQDRNPYQSVGRECRSRTSLGDDHTSQCRACHGPQLTNRTVQADGGRQPCVTHHLVDEHLPRRPIDRTGDAQGNAGCVDHPHIRAAHRVPHGEAGGQQRGDGLADQEDTAFGEKVHQDAADGTHHQHGQELECNCEAHGGRTPR
ncbi:hypothetical protein D3C73_1195090 [compost metagenome]